jgi:hypothetical protein
MDPPLFVGVTQIASPGLNADLLNLIPDKYMK